MLDDQTLLPPLAVIHERLTRNARERDRLRTLQRLIVQAREEGLDPDPDPAEDPDAVRRPPRGDERRS
jgi:hypothetical protein